MKRISKAIIFLLLVLAISAAVLYMMEPVNPGSHHTIRIVIPGGTSAREIANKLYQNKLIKSKIIFNILINVRGLENSLKAGTYEIDSAYNMDEIIDLLVAGRIATFRVTIPEGFTVEDIAKRLATLTPYSEGVYLHTANKNLGRDYLDDKQSLDDKKPKVRYVLEGYLYPDTYIIPEEYRPEQIYDVMLSLFEERWLDKLQGDRVTMRKESTREGSTREDSTIEDSTALDSANEQVEDRVETREQLPARGTAGVQQISNDIVGQFTPREIMTVASLVEKEARLNEEKPIIAAVIYNRLKRNMLLQIDACIQYIMDDRKDKVLYSDLQIDSPYNTYKYHGLPPGPISNPGAGSIEAALHPASVSYLFYFARKDGSHVFSHSYAEHIRLQKEMRGK